MQVYTGKKDGGQPEHGLEHCIVSDLVGNQQGKNYHIFYDNFFTSIRLAEDLLAKNLYLCGTTPQNKTDFPSDLKPNKPEVKALRHGESIFWQKENIVATVWKDKKLVSYISTQCDVRGYETVRRKQNDGRYIKVPTIPTVTLYNKYMGESITTTKCASITRPQHEQISGGATCFGSAQMRVLSMLIFLGRLRKIILI